MISTPYKAATYYASLGYEVFPCMSGAKHPLTKHGVKDATSDLDMIEKWWQRWPEANVAVSTNNMLVVDVDGDDNKWPNNDELLDDLESGVVSATPRGGRHYIFQCGLNSSYKNTTNKIGRNVDTRGQGGYIIVPPSKVNDKQYLWISLLTEYDKLDTPPYWLSKLLLETNGNKRKRENIFNNEGNNIPKGQRNATLASIAGTMRRIGLTSQEVLPALTVVNKKRCDPPTTEIEVERIVTSVCSYEPDQMSVAMVEHHFEQNKLDDKEIIIPEPPPMLSDSMMRIGGFISELIDHCLATAPYPNQALAFTGALALQSLLGARIFRDPGDNRTNLYLLGLAYSASGKDWPRKLNVHILDKLNMMNVLGDKFASGEGLQDALYLEPAMLFQTDEIDGMLLSIKSSKDPRYENIMNTLLTLYTSANSVFPMRRRAGQEETLSINQPSLTIFGTAIPNHYYDALSEKMLSNGFFGRMLVLEGGKRSKGQEPSIIQIPDRILNAAISWKHLGNKLGLLNKINPEPATVEHSEKAIDVLVDTRIYTEEEYSKAEDRNDVVGTTVWGRVSEMTRKLSLICAISENPLSPKITSKNVKWAREFVYVLTRRMLYNANRFVADTPFHAQCNKIKSIINKSEDRSMEHSLLLKHVKIERKLFQNIIETMLVTSELQVLQKPSKRGPSKKIYSLLY